MLTQRRQQILRFVVDEYVRSAQPVASETLAYKYGLTVSPATIRHELMSLEEEGYLSQPHASAGRLPSDKGYRYYVEMLMAEEEPSAEAKRTIRHQFHQAARQIEEWAPLTAAILASQVGNLAVVTAPRSAPARLRWLELVRVQEFLALLVLVLQEMRLRQQTLALDRSLEQEELMAIARKLTHLFAGMTGEQIRQRTVELSAIENLVTQVIEDTLAEEDIAHYEPAFLEGLRNILGQPEFAHGQRMLEIIDILDERNLPRALPLGAIASQGVTVIIGGEHPENAMRPCSLVIGRYGSAGTPCGLVAVVGPTRMHYPRAVAMVRYMGSLLDELMAAYFG